MIAHADRIKAVKIISEAVSAGAGRSKACSELGISIRTYRRWHGAGVVKADGRVDAQKNKPANALSTEERTQIIEVCNQKEYRSQPPSQIVPSLADKGIYIASESSFYRVLRDANQVQRRGSASPSQRRSQPTEYTASKPNQVWSWDITFLPSLTIGVFFRLYTQSTSKY